MKIISYLMLVIGCLLALILGIFQDYFLVITSPITQNTLFLLTGALLSVPVCLIIPSEKINKLKKKIAILNDDIKSKDRELCERQEIINSYKQTIDDEVTEAKIIATKEVCASILDERDKIRADFNLLTHGHEKLKTEYERVTNSSKLVAELQRMESAYHEILDKNTELKLKIDNLLKADKEQKDKIESQAAIIENKKSEINSQLKEINYCRSIIEALTSGTCPK